MIGINYYMVMPYFGCDLHEAMLFSSNSTFNLNLNPARLLKTLVENLLYLQ